MHQALIAGNTAAQLRPDCHSFGRVTGWPISHRGGDRSLYYSALSCYLHEPEKKVRRLLRANRRYLKRVEQYRNSVQGIARLNQHLASFRFTQQEAFTEFLGEYPKSRILAGFHFGDFIYSNNVVAAREEEGREQCFLAQLPPSAAFLGNMSRCFGERAFAHRQQLIASEVSPARLIARLGNDNTTLLTFVDLPDGFGKRIKVSFLGREAWFPKGPSLLSVAATVPVIPVISYLAGGTNHIRVHPLINPRADGSESRESACLRITQSLVDILEAYLSLFPWQWRYLAALPSFFHESKSSEQQTQGMATDIRGSLAINGIT